MSQSIRLIVGLGNPTPRYEKTRHNAGFWFVDGVARELRVSMRPELRFQGAFGRGDAPGGVMLLKPSTYMNRSGSAVAAVLGYFKLRPDQLLVAHDELDLAPGVVRLKSGGGHGGHNGLKDIVAHLGTADFLRLRLGIGHPGDRDRVADYVLDAPNASDGDLIDKAIERGLLELDDIVRGETARAMNRLNTSR